MAVKALVAVLMSFGVLVVAPAAASGSAPVQCWELTRTSDSGADVILWRCVHAVYPEYHGQIINGIPGDAVLVRRLSWTVRAQGVIPPGATSADSPDVDDLEAPYQVCFRRNNQVGNCTGFYS